MSVDNDDLTRQLSAPIAPQATEDSYGNPITASSNFWSLTIIIIFAAIGGQFVGLF